MKYIFDLYWFNNGGRQAFNLTPDDYQTEPIGGWGNWTARHNVDFMLRMFAAQEPFTLIGNSDTLIGQAKNAGDKNTRCMVGAEVLLLLAAGYTPWVAAAPQRQQGQLIVFYPPSQPVPVNQGLIQDAYNYLDNKAHSKHFWTGIRKETYKDLIGKCK